MNAEQENKRHSIVVPIIFAGLIVVLMIALIVLVWYLNSVDPAPFGVVQIFTLIALAVCAGVIYACIERIKEILRRRHLCLHRKDQRNKRRRIR